MHHVLFVDGDPVALQTNRSYFSARGCKAAVADSAEEALRLVREHDFDCVISEVMLPYGTDGFTLCRKLRQNSGVPVLLLTELAEREALYRGFKSGGDDFLYKPYDLEELYLRVEARIRRYRNQQFLNEVLVFPPLRIDLTSRQVTVGDQVIRFTGGEFDILAFLCANPNQVFSPKEIYSQVWKQPSLDATHTVQVHMSHLRRKLEEAAPDRKFLQTVWGKGYLFAPQPVETTG